MISKVPVQNSTDRVNLFLN